MTSTVQPSATPITAPAAQANAQSSASGNTSYANATKGASLGNTAKVGGLAASQYATPPTSQAPLNGRPSAPSNAPSGPAIVSSTNGTPNPNDHGRAPSVTISAQGTQGYAPAGAAAGPAAARPNISFGSIGGSPSPAMSHSTLAQPQAGHNRPRSPSPIPPPTSSGGRPPSSLAGQGPVNFGSIQGADFSDPSQLPLRPASGIPLGPAAGPQAQHLRRESSQSTHSNANSNFGTNGRNTGGRPPYANQQYGNNQQNSPSMFRATVALSQRTPSTSPFQQQIVGRASNSPYPANRSPALHTNSPHLNGGVQAPFATYPQMQPNPNMYMGEPYAPPYYAGYPPNGAYMPPGMSGMQMPGMFQPPQPGMVPNPPTQFRQQQPYAPGPYAPAPAQMSRQSSQSGDPRPSSAMGAPSPAHGQSPSPGPPAAASGSGSFTRPQKKSSAIRITNADGEVVDFKSKLQTPASVATVKPSGPAVVSSGGSAEAVATPARAVTPASQHSRAESGTVKPEMTEEERKKKFAEDFKRQLAGGAEKEEPKPVAEKEEPEPVAEKEEPEPVAKNEEPKPVAETEEPEPAAEKEVPEPEPEPVAQKVEPAPEKAEEVLPNPEEEAKAESVGETEEERKKREDDEEMERMIAEMEAAEKAEEERERKFAEQKKAAEEEKKKKEAEAAANPEDELRRLEREAEAREEAKAKGKGGETESDSEAASLFAKLKKNPFGPQEVAQDSGASTPVLEPAMPPPTQPASAPKAAIPAALSSKQKPAALKLETTKAVEPAQETAGMMSLKSARFLQVKNDVVNYPEGIKSPNPALNQNTRGRGQRYDNGFLLQFREVFKEKPSIDWDKVLKDTVGDGGDPSKAGSARTPSVSSGRSMSNRGGSAMGVLGAMGAFGAGGRTLPPGTSSEQRFNASNMGAGRGMPFAAFSGGRTGAPFPMGSTGMVRTPSSQSMQGMNTPRNASHRGKGSRRGGQNPAADAEMRKKMPLTADLQITPLEVSQTGWKPTNIGAPVQSIVPGTHLTPDLVQRKVKAALNKMTPEKFDKIANDILVIASQSKDESDGRTLRQVIQLTFEKACDEAHWASMYAKFCQRMLQDMGPDIRDENVKDKNGNVVVGGALFRKYLLNRCQEEFERGWEVNLPEVPEGQTNEAVMLSDEYYIAAAAKRRGLGLIQFIGELYKLGMLTLRIMHECVVKLLNFEGTPDEAAIESLVKLLRTIGATMDSDPKGHSMIDTYIDRVTTIMNMEGLPSRMYYMLLDTVDLKRAGWRSKDDAKGPKTISEIRDEAAAAHAAAELERQRSGRGGPGGRMPMGRGDSRNFSAAMQPDYPRNQVGMDDLKKLTRNARPSSSATGGLGPNSLLSSSRSGSRRGGLGPRVGDESGASSRTNTPPVKAEKDTATSKNTYHLLAGLDGDHPDDVASPPSQHASPAPAKAEPVAAAGGAEAGGSA